MKNLNDKLDDMFVKQEALMKRYAERDESFPAWPIDLSNKQHQKFVRDCLMNAVEEVCESSRELKNHKQHRETNIKDFDRAKFVEEIVDTQKFVIESMIMLGITPEEFKRAYDKKDALCHQRLNEKY